MKAHLNLNPLNKYRCPICNITFRLKMTLINHMNDMKDVEEQLHRDIVKNSSYLVGRRLLHVDKFLSL